MGLIEKNPGHLVQDSEAETVSKFLYVVECVSRNIIKRLPADSFLDFQDLYNAGVLGLIDGVRKFSPDKGCKIQTYISHRIRGAILDEIRSVDHLDRGTRRLNKTILKAENVLEQRLGRKPCDWEVAKDLGLSDELYRELKQRVSVVVKSLEADLTAPNEEGTFSVYEIVPTQAASAFEVACQQEAREKIFSCLGKIPGYYSQVLTEYYWEGRTLKEIADARSLSESRICQILQKARRLIKPYLHELAEVVPATAPKRSANPRQKGGEVIMKNPLDMKISAVTDYTTAMRISRALNISTLRDLTAITETELMEQASMRSSGVKNIKGRLAQLGLSLRNGAHHTVVVAEPTSLQVEVPLSSVVQENLTEEKIEPIPLPKQPEQTDVSGLIGELARKLMTPENGVRMESISFVASVSDIEGRRCHVSMELCFEPTNKTE